MARQPRTVHSWDAVDSTAAATAAVAVSRHGRWRRTIAVSTEAARNALHLLPEWPTKGCAVCLPVPVPTVVAASSNILIVDRRAVRACKSAAGRVGAVPRRHRSRFKCSAREMPGGASRVSRVRQARAAIEAIICNITVNPATDVRERKTTQRRKPASFGRRRTTKLNRTNRRMPSSTRGQEPPPSTKGQVDTHRSQ